MSSGQIPPVDSGQISILPLDSTDPLTSSTIPPMKPTCSLSLVELQSASSTLESQVVVDLSANSLTQKDDTSIPPASVLDPKYGWVAPPDLILNCAMESLMPSLGRFMGSTCEAPRYTLSETFFNGETSHPSSSPLSQAEKTVNSHLAKAIQVEKTVDDGPTLATTTSYLAKANGNEVPPKSSSSLVTHVFQTTLVDSSCVISTSNTTSTPKPPLGAWASPFKIAALFPALENSSAPSHKIIDGNRDFVPSLNEQWPALAAGKQMRKRSPPLATSTSQKTAAVADVISPLAQDIIKASQEYPWAAKMKSVCNLRRVTNPVYMEDGTPKVNIPSHVLLEGIENQSQFVVGQFYRCKAPSGGLIHAVATHLWGRKCRIFTRKLGESSYLFHIPDEATRKWVIQRGIWHIDDCLMFVSPWSPSPVISLPEISTIPVWLTLQNIPYQLYSIKGIDWIASGIGEPMLTSKPWLDPTQMGEAKILVEVKLNKPFPQRVALEDNSGSITMVNVLYSWLPPKCGCCGQLGHKASHCLGANDPVQESISVVVESTNVEASGSTIAPVQNDDSTPKTIFSVLDSSLPKAGILETNAQSAPAKDCTPIEKTVKNKKVNFLVPTENQTHIIDVPLYETTPLLAPSTTDAPPVAETTSSLEDDAFDECETTDFLSTPITSSTSVPPFVVHEQGNSLPHSALELDSNLHASDKYVSDEKEDVYVGESNPFAVLDQIDIVNDGSTSQWSRGGRPIKPTQKIQEMLWTKGGGRRKRGRGRG